VGDVDDSPPKKYEDSADRHFPSKNGVESRRGILGFNLGFPPSFPSQIHEDPNDKGEAAAPVSQHRVRSQQVSIP